MDAAIFLVTRRLYRPYLFFFTGNLVSLPLGWFAHGRIGSPLPLLVLGAAICYYRWKRYDAFYNLSLFCNAIGTGFIWLVSFIALSDGDTAIPQKFFGVGGMIGWGLVGLFVGMQIGLLVLSIYGKILLVRARRAGRSWPDPDTAPPDLS